MTRSPCDVKNIDWEERVNAYVSRMKQNDDVKYLRVVEVVDGWKAAVYREQDTGNHPYSFHNMSFGRAQIEEIVAAVAEQQGVELHPEGTLVMRK